MIGQDLESRLEEAYDRVKKFVHRTPVLGSTFLNKKTGARLSFKCENFQRMGAFKMRGATNAILSLSEEQRKFGVVTHSSGNMAQAVSLAAKTLGVPAYIVMPENAPQVKVNAVKQYGGIVTLSPSTIEDRERMASEIISNTGAHFIHPSNDMDVILGQGTAALELMEEVPDLDVIIVPVGGGGLLAGTALACHFKQPHIRVMAGEPIQVDDAYRSMQSGAIAYNQSSNTIADGLRTHLGDINFPIIQSLVDRIIRVEEQEIVFAMKLVWERMKIVVEASSAVPLAALIRTPEIFKDQKVGIIVSGGNVDLSKLPF